MTFERARYIARKLYASTLLLDTQLDEFSERSFTSTQFVAR
jgi:hypothetical protein